MFNYVFNMFLLLLLTPSESVHLQEKCVVQDYLHCKFGGLTAPSANQLTAMHDREAEMAITM